MYLELADNGITTKGSATSAPMLPVINPATQEIILMDAQALNMLDPVEFSEALENMPTLVGAMQDAQGIPPAQQISAAELISAAIDAAPAPGNQAKWSGSVNIEPAAKPWFARPEVLLPVLGLAAVTVYSLSRRR